MMWLIALLLGLLLPDPAAAMPGVATAISVALAASSAGASFGAAIAAGFGALSTTFVGKLIVGAAFTLVGQLFRKKPGGIRDGGIQTEQTTTGDITPQKFVVGRYGLEGHAVAPAYSRGPNNRILTYILEFSNIPVQGLTDRIIIDGQYTDIGAPDADGNRELTGLQNGGAERAWIRIHDGTQTTADAGLVAAYSEHPDRPWTTDHVLRGSAYAVLEFRRDQNVFPGLPSVRFEVDGIRLYDPRKDTSVGGQGAQRWANPATWAGTRNPQVIKYNIFRGITLPTGDIYGGGSDAEDLPLDNWFAAMNECDVLIGDRPQFEAGFEINTNDMEPLDVIEEMDRACFGQTSEFGGVWRTRTGAPGAPVMALTDDDFMITEASDTTLFPGLPQTFNAASGSFVDPASVWQSRDADEVTNAEWEAEDRNRRLPRAINLPAVSNNSQAQHLLESYLKDSRRFRTHTMTLPPSFALLEPLDTLTWTSEENGYDAKVFEVVEVEDRPSNLTQRVNVREREPGDVAWTSDQDLPAPVGRLGRTLPAPVTPSIIVSDLSIRDSLGVSRRAALLVEWTGEQPVDALVLIVQVRVVPGLDRVARVVARTEDGEIEINDGILHATTYEVRARYLFDAPGEWSDWVSVTTGAGGFTAADLAADFSAKIDTAFDRHDAVLGDAGAPQAVTDLFDRIEQTLSPIGVGDIPGTPHVERLTNDLAAEVQARAAAVNAEATERAGDVLAVAGTVRRERGRIKSAAQLALDSAARDFLARDEVRTTLVAGVEGARAEASAAITTVADAQVQIAQSVQTLETTTADISALTQTIDQARIDGDEGLANQIALLAVGTVTQFDHVAIWHFDATVEGWTGVSAAPGVTSDGFLAPATGSGVVSPSGLAVVAQTYRQVRARIRRDGPTTWTAQLWWAGTGESFDVARRVDVTEPDFVDDVAQLTVNLDWSGTVDRIRLDLPTGVEIDWLAIGRPAPGASSAEVAAETAARIAQDQALAGDITALGAELTDVEALASGTADALTDTNARVTANEDGIVSLTDATTALQSDVSDVQTGLSLTGDAVDALETRAETLEGGERVQSEATRAVRSRVKLSGAQNTEEAARAILGRIKERELLAQASQGLNTRIDLTDDEIRIVSDAVTVLQSAIPGLATADALQALETTVTGQGDSLTSLSQSLLSLTSEVNTNAAAIASEQTTRANADSTLASDITALTADVANNAAAILSEQTARVNADIAQASDITALTVEVGNNATAIVNEQTARSNADSGLAADISALTVTVDGNTAAISNEQIARVGADNALASDISALTTRVGDTEADITTIQGTKVDASGAVAAVTQEISASYGSMTALATATAFSDATVSGITAGHVLRLNSQSVWEVVSVSDGTSGPIVTGRWSGDYLQLDGNVDVTGDFKVGGDNLFANTILAENIVASGITRFAVAGSGEIKNNSATFTTIATATFEAPVDFKAQGILSFLLTDPPADYPNDVLFRALIQGTVVANITKAGLLNANARRITLPVTLTNGIAAASVEIKLEVQNAGGLGAENSNYSVTGFLR